MRGHHGHRPPLPVRRVSQARADVLLRQLGKVLDDFLMAHAAGQPAEHIRDRDAHSPDARLAAALARLHRDEVLVIHAPTLLHAPRPAKRIPDDLAGGRS